MSIKHNQKGVETYPLAIVCLSLSDFRQTEGVGFRENLVLKPKEKDKNSCTFSLPRAQVQSLFQEQSHINHSWAQKKEVAATGIVIYIHLSIEASSALTKNLNTSLKQKFNLFNIIKRYLLKVKQMFLKWLFT